MAIPPQPPHRPCRTSSRQLAAAGGTAAAGQAANAEDMDVTFGADMAAQLEAMGAEGLDDLGIGDLPLGDDL